MSNKVTHEDHLELAKEFVEIEDQLNKFLSTLLHKFPKTNSITRSNLKVRSAWNRLKSELDNHYHSVTSVEQFNEKKHVYYQIR